MTSASAPFQRPWIHRLYDRSPVPPWAAALLTALVVGGAFVGLFVALAPDHLPRALRDLRISVVNIALIAYLPAAGWYVSWGARRSTAALLPRVEASEQERRELLARAGHYDRGRMRRAGAYGVAVALLAPILVDRSLVVAFDPRIWTPEMMTSRVTSWLAGWWGGQFVATVLIESSRLSMLAARLRRIDLFDLDSLAPFTRQGMIHALLTIGALSIFTLLLVEGGFGPVVALLGLADAVLAGAGLMLPVRGVHRKIRRAKAEQLERCRATLREAHRTLADDADGSALRRVTDLLTYRDHLERVREWPFDVSTATRFGAYLLIPLLSWAGGALVERGVDRLLD